LARRVVGFYTDEEKRVRPITKGASMRRVKLSPQKFIPAAQERTTRKPPKLIMEGAMDMDINKVRDFKFSPNDYYKLNTGVVRLWGEEYDPSKLKHTLQPIEAFNVRMEKPGGVVEARYPMDAAWNVHDVTVTRVGNAYRFRFRHIRDDFGPLTEPQEATVWVPGYATMTRDGDLYVKGWVVRDTFSAPNSWKFRAMFMPLEKVKAIPPESP
jgi:hypothetical protein